jgi:hypothetical protein
VPQESARREGGEDEADRTYVSARPVPARGVPLRQHFVYDLGDPIVDRVALVVGRLVRYGLVR